MIEKFNQFLIQLGIDLHLVLLPDPDGSVTIKVNKELIIQIKIDKTQSDILIGSFLCPLPPGKFRENILINTLKSNGEIPISSIFAFNEPSGELVLFKYLSLEKNDFQSFKHHLEEFIEKGMDWKEAISSGQAAPLAFIRELEHSKSSIFNMNL
jgi:hypothetical protein